MRIRFTIVSAVALTALFALPAGAQLADKRSFMHPLGFWSNNYYVAQKRIYPRALFIPARYADARILWSSEGGGLLHERNW
jgi:hypothetical protein